MISPTFAADRAAVRNDHVVVGAIDGANHYNCDVKPAISLPPPEDLERICRGLAVLDAILCEEWQDRYFSFDAAWNEEANQRMASMRNGHGDQRFMVFDAGGVFAKAFWHEYPRQRSAKVFAELPAALRGHLKEPAFDMKNVTFGAWHDGTEWTFRGDAVAPLITDDLSLLTGDAKKYRAYAEDYFETTVSLEAIEHVLAGNRLDAKLVERIAPGRTLASLKEDLAEIGY